MVALAKPNWKPEGRKVCCVIQTCQPSRVDNGVKKGGEQIWRSRWKVPNILPYIFHDKYLLHPAFYVLHNTYHHMICYIFSYLLPMLIAWYTVDVQ